MTALKELQNYTFVSKYANWLPDKNRRETWPESVSRVKEMMLKKYADKPVQKDIEWAYDFMYSRKALGSQRALQFGGKPVEKINVRQYNCSGSHCDRGRFFQEAMWILLCGAGTGFSVQKHHIAKLPSFSKVRISREPLARKIFVIPDSIEGWADAVGVLISSFLCKPTDAKFKEYQNYDIEFDYSQIRPKGSSLSSSSGKAPGPDPLRHSLDKILDLLIKCCSEGQKRLRPIDASDIVLHCSDAVLSGGVRRSSCLVLFSKDDQDMLTAKTGNWRKENPQRARANMSVALLRNDLSLQDVKDVIQHTREYGDPGFLFVDSLEYICNPCGEANFYCVHEGETGWGFCNLSTINCGSVTDATDFYQRCKAAAIMGTLQAGFTDMGYLGETTRKIVEREALLGVSMTGILENIDIVLRDHVLEKGAKIILQTNEDLAKKIGINVAARTTLLKPEGSTSAMLGTSSSIHPHHSSRYMRLVMANTTEPPYQYFKQHNQHSIEKSVWSNTGTDEVIYFPIEVPVGSKTKHQVPAIEMLKMVKQIQTHWVQNGKRPELCIEPWLTHNVSNTVIVQDNEWEEVAEYIYKNKQYFTGVTLLSASGDKDYPQAPFTAVYTAREQVREYGDAALWCSGLIENALDAFGTLWEASDYLLDEQMILGDIDTCSSVQCVAKLDVYAKQARWILKAQKFAKKYFDNDIKKLTYCMKDVYNWKKYTDLVENFEHVDYTKLRENTDNTKPLEEVACGGGACLI